MKILVINGSPRKNGTIATLLKAAIEGASISGKNEIEWIDVYELNMHYCIGCMKCRPDNECILQKDDAHIIGRKIKEADALIIGTPTYWANMSSQLKVLFERNVTVFMGIGKNGFPIPRKAGRPAIIVTSCNTIWPFNFLTGQSSGSIKSIKEVLTHGGYKILGYAVKAGVRKNPKISSRLLQKTKKLGQKLKGNFNEHF